MAATSCYFGCWPRSHETFGINIGQRRSAGQEPVWVQTTPQSPAYVLYYSSFNPPSSGLNVYFVSHKRSSFQVPQILKSFGNFRGLGAFVFAFCVDT